MRIVNLLQAGTDHEYKWPGNYVEPYPFWVDYKALGEDGEHSVRIGFGSRWVYDQDRSRIVVWIDGYPHVEFFGADDFEVSGEVLSEIRLRSDGSGEVMCRYPDEVVPERYTAFNTVSLKTRVATKGVHNAWAVVANISDHRTMIALATLRRIERKRKTLSNNWRL